MKQKSGTRNFGSQIANRLINQQTSCDLARDGLNSTDGDFTFILRNLLNQPFSFEDGHYSYSNKCLNSSEVNAVIKYLKLNNNEANSVLKESKIFGRFRHNHELFYARVYDSLHKRQSSVCKWNAGKEENYGIIEKFIKYQDKEMFIAQKFIGKRKLTDYYKFSDSYKAIFDSNDLDKYFTVFSYPENDDTNIIACSSNSILSTCVITKLNDSNDVFVTAVIGFEHD